jgi:hypothetical protein
MAGVHSTGMDSSKTVLEAKTGKKNSSSTHLPYTDECSPSFVNQCQRCSSLSHFTYLMSLIRPNRQRGIL